MTVISSKKPENKGVAILINCDNCSVTIVTRKQFEEKESITTAKDGQQPIQSPNMPVDSKNYDVSQNQNPTSSYVCKSA